MAAELNEGAEGAIPEDKEEEHHPLPLPLPGALLSCSSPRQRGLRKQPMPQSPEQLPVGRENGVGLGVEILSRSERAEGDQKQEMRSQCTDHPFPLHCNWHSMSQRRDRAYSQNKQTQGTLDRNSRRFNLGARVHPHF